MIQKVIRVGNSTAVTIPKNILVDTKIQTGDKVCVEQDEATGAIIVSKTGKPFKGLSGDIASWTKKFIETNRQALKELANK